MKYLLNPVSGNPTKWSNSINLSAICLSVFDHFVGLTIRKGLTIRVVKWEDHSKHCTSTPPECFTFMFTNFKIQEQNITGQAMDLDKYIIISKFQINTGSLFPN